MMLNLLTVDVEPWMALYPDIPMTKSRDNGQLAVAMRELLHIFNENNVNVTFFMLGIIYEWFPDLVDEIVLKNHEIAFHGYNHKDIKNEVLKSDIEKSRYFIRKYNVRGFRAPRMRIWSENLMTLQSEGFLYDSSIYGSFSPYNSIANIQEVPVSTYPIQNLDTFPITFGKTIRNLRIPFGSGLFMASLNSSLLDALIRKINKQNRPAVLTIHPWQLTGVPIVQINGFNSLLRIPYLFKLEERKLRHLLREHKFTTIQRLLEDDS